MKVKTGNVWMEVDSKGNVVKVYGTGLTKTNTIEIPEFAPVDKAALKDPFELVLNGR